jgi:transposase
MAEIHKYHKEGFKISYEEERVKRLDETLKTEKKVIQRNMPSFREGLKKLDYIGSTLFLIGLMFLLN